MICSEHRKPIEYVCKSTSCDYTMLCDQCRKGHLQSRGEREKHIQSIVSIKSAIAQAQGRLGQQKQTLQQLLSPFNNQEQMHRMIEEQKKLLNRQRQQIIKQINAQFDAEIRQLENSNEMLLGKKYQDFPLQEINQKLQHINDLQSQFKKDHLILRQTLAFSIDLLMDKIRDQHPQVVSSMQMQSNQYWSYGQIKHDFFLSKLNLKKQVFNFKLLKKMHNNSKLYFLIDNYDQGKHLHYFSPTDSCIRVYNIQQEKWKSHISTMEVPNFGATIHDPKSGRFYLIGGIKSRDKSSDIIWYHKQNGWGQARMNTPRSSAMVSLIDSGQKDFDYVLIAGGIGANKKHLKLCELFNPKTNNSEYMSPMNFGVSSGTLVNFNGNKVFRIGGLGQFNRDSASICEIVQKFEYDGGQGKWSYVQLQVVNPDITNKFKLFHANQAAIQINPNEIFVFGGWSHGNSGVKESYIVEVQQITIKGKKSHRYYVRWINEKPLISGQGFADLRPIIHNRRIVSLQNITHGENEVLQREKKLIQFDMYKWYEYQNIVNI